VTKWKKALQDSASSVFDSASIQQDDALKQKLKEDRLRSNPGQRYDQTTLAHCKE